MEKEQKTTLIRIIISAALLGIAVLLSRHSNYAFLYFIPAYLLAGYEVLIETVEHIFKGDLLDEDFLMSAASIGAFIIGKYPEAVAVMLFFEIGEWFEDFAVEKSRNSIRELAGLRPDKAHVLIDGISQTIPPQDVRIGEEIVVQPGERVPLDGIIIDGICELDLSALTGESIPVSATIGDPVSSGSVDTNALIKIRVTKCFEDSTATRIVKLVEESENNKSKSESFTTRFARIYTPLVCLFALLLAIVPSVITGDWNTWVYRGLLFLVVSCPCALVISVPLSFFAGIGRAAKRGIIIKGGQFIEVLSKATCAVFDKTGTLTEGKLKVHAVIPEKGITKEELLTLTASAEQYSTHPIALCIINYSNSILPATDVTEIAGQGVSAVIKCKRVLSGNIKLAQSNGVDINFEHNTAETSVYTFVDGVYYGRIALSDQPKASAATAIKDLKKLGISETVLLTGDTKAAGETLAQQIGISSYKAQLMPEEKVSSLEAIMNAVPDRVTIYVGDGINDAPVLARADVGIAMGALGADAAIESADIVLMDDDPLKLPLAITLSRKTMRIVKENIFFALIVKALVLILGAFGMTNMWLAVFADVGVTVLAVLNSIRDLNTPAE